MIWDIPNNGKEWVKNMGTWGTKLFQDDFASDIRDTYLDLLKYQFSNKDAEVFMLKQFLDPDMDDEEALFWIAFASVKWDVGRLDEETKKKAIERIDNGSSLELWEETDDEKLLEKRKKVLNDVKEKLLSKQPKERKFRKPRETKKFGFQVGDILAYKMTDEEYLDSPNWDYYFFFHVYKVVKNPITNLIPDSDYEEYYNAALFKWKGKEIPKDLAFLDNINYECLREWGDNKYFGENLDLYPTKFARGNVTHVGYMKLREEEIERINTSGSFGLSAMDSILSKKDFN